MLEELIATGKKFKFKQGLDERLLTDEKCHMLFSSNYDGDFTFAFDNIADYDLIKSKLEMIRKYTKTNYLKFYVLVGFESTTLEDIENAFKRVDLLMQYHCVPYIMRFQSKNETPWKESEFRGMYTQLARWCNQQHLYKKMSFRQFCIEKQKQTTQNMAHRAREAVHFQQGKASGAFRIRLYSAAQQRICAKGQSAARLLSHGAGTARHR